MRQITVSFAMVLLVSACGDPLQGVARLNEVETAAGAANVAPVAEEATPTRSGGLFGRLLNRSDDDPTNAAIEEALADVGETASDSAEAREETSVAAAQPAAPERGGLFGLFGRRIPAEVVAEVPATPEAVEALGDEDAQVVQVAVTPAPQEQATPPRGLAGLFRRGPGRPSAPRTGPDAADVTAGTAVPFGEVARVCDARRSDFGVEIEGGGGFRVFDTNPSSTAPRPFYVTGFADNCARTFTGAVVVAGNTQAHEFIRYQPSNERISYTTADNAYEAIKANVCRVGRGQPCGARADRLNRNTTFITAYGFFGGTFSAVPTRWTQILLHDGNVLAVSIKEG